MFWLLNDTVHRSRRYNKDSDWTPSRIIVGQQSTRDAFRMFSLKIFRIHTENDTGFLTFPSCKDKLQMTMVCECCNRPTNPVVLPSLTPPLYSQISAQVRVYAAFDWTRESQPHLFLNQLLSVTQRRVTVPAQNVNTLYDMFWNVSIFAVYTMRFRSNSSKQ